MKRLIKEIFQEAYHKHVVLLASSSTFFLILSFIPFFLLSLKIIGIFLGDYESQIDTILSNTSTFLPDNLEGLESPIKKIVMGSLFASKESNIFNISFLIISSFGFINSLWRGLLVITEDNDIYNYKKYIKGFLIITLTLLFFMSTLFIPFILNLITKFLNISLIQKTLDFLHLDNIINFSMNYIFNNHWLSALIILIYMSGFFKLLLTNRLSWKNSFKGSFLFFILLSVLKWLFSYYIMLTKGGLISNYGSYYNIIFVLIWLFSAIVLFYISVIATITLEKIENEPPPIPQL